MQSKAEIKEIRQKNDSSPRHLVGITYSLASYFLHTIGMVDGERAAIFTGLND
jgi:hypothetical protein